MQSINNVCGKLKKKMKRKHKQRLAQTKPSADVSCCSSQRALKAERNRGTGMETLNIGVVSCQDPKGPSGFNRPGWSDLGPLPRPSLVITQKVPLR